MELIVKWIRASRLPAQTFIFPSLLFGQALQYFVTGNFSWIIFFMIHIYGLFMHFFIVYANDYADFETDKINRTFTPFTGGSRVLVDGILTKNDLLKGAFLMSFLSILSGITISIMIQNYLVLLYVLIGLSLLYAYSFEPIKLSYRGCGELLQMTGVGIVLPLIGYTAQGGSLVNLPYISILILIPAQLAMAISTSLPDEPSDKISLKNTTVVLIGRNKAGILVVLLYVITFIAFLLSYKIGFSNPLEQIFVLFFALLIFVQIMITTFSDFKPGSLQMFYLVFLSILTNTSFIIWISLFLYSRN